MLYYVVMKVHISRITKRYKDKTYVCPLLVHSYRDENGKSRNKTILNLSVLPEHALEALDAALREGKNGERYNKEDIQYDTSLPVGDVWSVHKLSKDVGLADVLQKVLDKQDAGMVLAMIYDRVVSPKPHSKRALYEMIDNTLVPRLVGLWRKPSQIEWYRVLERLYNKKKLVEKQLYVDGGERVFLYDITSTYFEGDHCPIAEFGYNRDGKKGKKQVIVGLMTRDDGCPIAVEVFRGSTSDQTTVSGQITRLKEEFRVKNLVFVGDRGMITSTRIDEIESEAVERRIDYITALQRQKMMQLVEDIDHPLQLELFDEKDIAEVDYEGRRYMLCHNPFRKENDARTRQRLMARTEEKLQAIKRNVDNGRLKRKDAIAKRLYKWIDRWGMEKFFDYEFDEGKFIYAINQVNLERYSRLDGCYVIITSLNKHEMDKDEVVERYKSLAQVEQAFRSMKTEDLNVRPIRHWNEKRVRGHIFMCVLAYRLVWEARIRLKTFLVRNNTPYDSLRDLWECLSRISLGHFRIGSVFVEQLGSINKKQREVLKVLGIKLTHMLLSQEINP